MKTSPSQVRRDLTTAATPRQSKDQLEKATALALLTPHLDLSERHVNESRAFHYLLLNAHERAVREAAVTQPDHLGSVECGLLGMAQRLDDQLVAIRDELASTIGEVCGPSSKEAK